MGCVLGGWRWSLGIVGSNSASIFYKTASAAASRTWPGLSTRQSYLPHSLLLNYSFYSLMDTSLLPRPTVKGEWESLSVLFK